MRSESESYKAAGVDITAGYRAVELMRGHVARTLNAGVLEGLGGFGGLFELDVTGMEKPVLVGGTDGVGTKLKLAFLLDKHDSVGIDCVAMCVNDILCCGAKPLFFLDYIAMGKNVPQRVAAIVAGVAEGCVQAGCSLIGGETAEMPGFYPSEEYDLAGFAVGLVDKARILDKTAMAAGDALLALPSSGLHSNGFSLVRKAFALDQPGATQDRGLLERLLTPTKIYVKSVRALLESGVAVRAIAHITGGGFYENIPRALPAGMTARISLADVRTPPIFEEIARAGNIPQRDMYNTFNMGVGMAVVVARADADRAVAVLKQAGEAPYVLGEIQAAAEGPEAPPQVTLC